MKQLFIFCILALSYCSYANPNSEEIRYFNDPSYSLTEKIGSIQGSVTDKFLQDPLPYVTVVIQNMDGDIVTGGITNDEGIFNIKDIPEGKFVVKVQYIGYKTFSREIEITKANSNVEIGNIALEEDVAALDEVTIIAEQSTIVQKIDRRVINVGRDLTTIGATAGEIMNNIPSVNVDQDGNISLRGNPNVRILVDGKPTNIEAAQLLRQIPSTSIKQIELITNPSAKYDPEGMSGIINIILHKNVNDGFNGDISLGLTKGINARFNSSINLNYRVGKFNFYGNYGAHAGKHSNEGRINKFNNPNTSFDESSLETFDILNNNKSHLLKFGVDYFIDDKNSFSTYVTRNIFDGRFNLLTNIYYYDGRMPISMESLFDSENFGTTYNAAYKHKFNDDGHEIQLEADYNTFEREENAFFDFANSAFPNYRDFIFNNRENIMVNLDYSNPLTENSKLELGAEARLQRIDNDYQTTAQSLNNADFYYNRDILSAYATYGQNFDKWSYQFGARLESYKVDAMFNQEGSDAAPFEDDIFTVYPSAFVSYKINDKNSLQLSYSRRVDRPGLEQINPIRQFSTPQITSVGNQELNPQFTNSIEMNYTKQLEKGSITGGVFYRLIKDQINRSIEIDPMDPSKVIQSYNNFDDNHAYGFEFSGSYRFTKWWSVNGSFDLYQQTLKGVVGTEFVEVDNTAYTARVNNSFRATKDLTFQLFGFYRGPNNLLQFNIDEFYFVNTGVRYNVMQGNATISFNYNDIFNTQRSVITSTRPTPFEAEFNWESQTWHVGLSYRFGGGKNKPLSRRQRDANEAAGGGGIF